MQKLTFYTQYILKGKYIYVLLCILFQSHEKFTFWRQLVFNKQQHAMKYVTHWIPNTLSLFIKMTHEKNVFLFHDTITLHLTLHLCLLKVHEFMNMLLRPHLMQPTSFPVHLPDSSYLLLQHGGSQTCALWSRRGKAWGFVNHGPGTQWGCWGYKCIK